MKPRLNDQQRECIADSYHDHLVYRAFVPVSLALKQARRVPLHPAELFYASFYFLDVLIALPRAHRPNYCRYSLWVELTEALDLQPEGEDEQEKAQLAAAEVMQALVHLLATSRVSSWLGTAQAVMESLMEHVSPEEAEAIETLLWRGVSTVGEENLRDWMSTYIQSKIGLSSDVAALLKKQKEEEASAPEAGAVIAASNLRIVKGCKTKLLIVLNAVYQAGWLKDALDRPLTNRDKALNDILRLAFGEEKPTQIGSTIFPARDFNHGKKHRAAIEELLEHLPEDEE